MFYSCCISSVSCINQLPQCANIQVSTVEMLEEDNSKLISIIVLRLSLLTVTELV